MKDNTNSLVSKTQSAKDTLLALRADTKELYIKHEGIQKQLLISVPDGKEGDTIQDRLSSIGYYQELAKCNNCRSWIAIIDGMIQQLEIFNRAYLGMNCNLTFDEDRLTKHPTAKK